MNIKCKKCSNNALDPEDEINFKMTAAYRMGFCNGAGFHDDLLLSVSLCEDCFKEYAFKEAELVRDGIRRLGRLELLEQEYQIATAEAMSKAIRNKLRPKTISTTEKRC